MPSIVAVPFATADLTGHNKIRVVRASTSTTWDVTVPVPAQRYYNHTDPAGGDLAKAVCDAIASATGLTVTPSWTWSNTYGRLRITFSGTAEITLKWTDATNTTFDGAWLGFNTASDSVSEGSSDNWIKAPKQAQRIWFPPSQVYSFERPRRTLQAAQTVGGLVTWRTLGEYTVQRPLFDLLPSPLLYAEAAEDDSLDDLLPDGYLAASGSNHSFEAAIWEPLSDARRLPIRYTPSSADLTAYQELQPDLERGGEAWLKDLDAVVKPLTGGEDEAGLLYLMGPMPWMSHQS